MPFPAIPDADTSGLYAVYIPLNADGLPAADLTAEDMKLIPVENQKTLDVTMEGAEGNRSYALMFVKMTSIHCIRTNVGSILETPCRNRRISPSED